MQTRFSLQWRFCTVLACPSGRVYGFLYEALLGPNIVSIYGKDTGGHKFGQTGVEPASKGQELRLSRSCGIVFDLLREYYASDL
jgi:hypothetical protein